MLNIIYEKKVPFSVFPALGLKNNFSGADCIEVESRKFKISYLELIFLYGHYS